MKAKKEYLILAVIIIAAGLYLVFHKKDQTQYQLPQLSKIEIEAITRMEIKTAAETLRLTKEKDQWLLAPKNYPADGAKVKSMLFALEEMVLTDLVSESQAYASYQLDDAMKISVKAWAGDKVVRALDIGKEAATYQHTFIRLPANPNVYHARGDFRRKFADNATDLRDREILAFDPDALQTIRVTSGADTLVLNRGKDPVPAAPQADQPKSDQTGARPAWLTAEDRNVEVDLVDSFLSSINNIKCERYLEGREKDEFSAPVFKISLDGQQAYTLSIFKKENEKDTGHPAISSFNAYPFTLSNDRLKNWQKTVAKLLGKEETSKEQ